MRPTRPRRTRLSFTQPPLLMPARPVLASLLTLALLGGLRLATPLAAHAQMLPTVDVAAADAARLSGLRYRMIGPARGGR